MIWQFRVWIKFILTNDIKLLSYAHFFDLTTTEGTMDDFLLDGVVDGRSLGFEGCA